MSDAKDRLSNATQFKTDALKTAFHAQIGPHEAAADLFLEQVEEDCAFDELADMSAELFARVLAEFWRFATQEAGDAPAIRIRRLGSGDGVGAPTDLLEVAQPDRPFLVDSIMGQVAELGFSVRAMFHPVVEVRGARRSMIQVHLDPIGEDREAALIAALTETLADVRHTVDDFSAMRDLMRSVTDELKSAPAPVAADSLAEDVAFLTWLADDRFVFLGARIYEYPRTADGGYAAEEPLIQPQGSLGVLRDPARAVLRRASEPAVLSAQVRSHIETGDPLTVAKSNLRSRVHRRAVMDYVGVKRYGADGKPSGEVRFVGLFTVEAYQTPAREVPLIRRKVNSVLARAGFESGGHNGKRLRKILEGYPRDELFQMSEDELFSISLGVLHLFDRPRVKLFTRPDPFRRFVSVLMFVPRERYDSGVRERAGQILAKAYGGRVSAYYPHFGEAPLARVHYIIGTPPQANLDIDLKAVEQQIADTARTWEDRFEAAARDGGLAMGAVGDTLTRYQNAFSAGYRELYDADEALADLAVIESLGADEAVRVRAFRKPTDTVLQFRFKLYRPGAAAPLSDVLPILEAMGQKALIEDGSAICFTDQHGQPKKVFVHEFLLQDDQGEHLSFADAKAPFEAAFTAVWNGRTESDGFNRLVLELGIDWREAALIRALARYRQQSGLDPSQAVQEEAMSAHPAVARLILDLFRTKFDPALAADVEARKAQAEATMQAIIDALQAVASLDHDRSLRRIALLVGAIQRTNFYQVGPDGAPKPHISFKIASRDLDDLPAPKPYREIFVWAPHVEGVHLRFGPVARGGLRWSDRRDDFRTEVLGLVKAQQVKNAVIVPVGSKGGFYPKQLPRGGAMDAVRTEAIRAYRTFLSGLLDITDNLDAAGKVLPPAGVVRHDGDDPYLVVAADKGTATFSDIANGIAEDYGFWLGDAFASGGSVGYDHKVMGITARGAWEAVKRHFRELGKDIQSQPFTVVGVGDMSGDVFGNGMLLSKQIKLLAAFDHRHIFLDPDPDPAVSWAERERMFKLPRSSWADYDASKISNGGGVFPRDQKSIPLTREVKAMLELTADAVSPAELMTAILKSQAELLYLGGIGTYVKASGETNADAGDKANDAIRVNGADLRVKVVGEGANLGLTQAGRIEFARNGGRINTDAIDNSAGVDSSDHEVNIKILTGQVEGAGKLTRPDRNVLLASMTEDVGRHVLVHNYDQTLALSLIETGGSGDLPAYNRFMADLEQRGRLDRKVEGLPGAMALNERAAAGQGLTRPELAVLLAYSKIDLFDEIVASTAPDDAAFTDTLHAYFPKALGVYAEEMKRHRLRREIIATVLANQIVNLCGPTFPLRLRASAGVDTRAMVIAFAAARRIFRLDEVWAAVAAADLAFPAGAQTALFQEIAKVLRRQTYRLAKRAARPDATVQGLVDSYQPAADALAAAGADLLSPIEQASRQARAQALVDLGAPQDLAARVAALRSLASTADIADLAQKLGRNLSEAARLYHAVGAAFAFDRLRTAASGLKSADAFETLAVRRLTDDLSVEQSSVAEAVAASAGAADPAQAAERWAAGRPEAAAAVRQAVEGIEAAGGDWTFAKLTIANAAVRQLAAG